MNRVKAVKKQNETARTHFSEIKNLIEQERVVRRDSVRLLL